MNISIKCCDLCHTPTNGIEHGITLTLGYSQGDWGSRQDHIAWEGEVCQKCYEEYTKIALAVVAWQDKRHGSRPPTIVVTEHDVSVVQENQPSPTRCKTSFLR